MRRENCMNALWPAMFAFAATFLLVGPAWSVDGESLIRVVVTQGAVEITGIGPPRKIDRAGSVRLGEWVKAPAGTVAWIVRDTGLEKIAPGTQTQILLIPSGHQAVSQRRSIFENLVALALPREQWSTPAITKGSHGAQTGLFRALYPRDCKVVDREPVFTWTGGSDLFELRLYRRGEDAWIWKEKVRGNKRVKTPAGQQLEEGGAYTWEIRDLRDPINVDLAYFETPTSIERQRLDKGLREGRVACEAAGASSFICKLAEAGLYRKEGYSCEAIRMLNEMRGRDTPNGVVETLLKALGDVRRTN